MTREELVTLCDDYVHRHAVDDAAVVADPTPRIVHCFRDAEISESEMQALLSYICFHEDEEGHVCEHARAADLLAGDEESFHSLPLPDDFADEEDDEDAFSDAWSVLPR
jgi:hypothetical protein